MNNKKNIASALLLQLAITAQGVILPRLVLMFFGSGVNGLVSSITQFLGFIALLEGGVGAVVLAELYRPIEEQNEDDIHQILAACQAFFNKLAIIFIVYTMILAVVYPIFISKQFSFAYTATMVLILSITTLSQYLFSITYKLYLQASQKIYVVNYISCVTIVINTVSAIAIINCDPSIHAVKLFSGIIYFLQPFVFRHFINRKYRLKNSFQMHIPKGVLKNRRSGFSQNLAHFINMNTDVAILTLFAALETVSVYTVYMLAITALNGIISSIGNSYQSALGKYIAENDTEKLEAKFSRFETAFWFLGVVAFSTCLQLINPFVSLYTRGISDANYFQPGFAAIIVIANMLYVLREPYRLLVLAAGKFKETNFGSVMEAVLNITISIFLVWQYGLIGVAVGTLIAITFRMLYFMQYLRKSVLYKTYKTYIPQVLTLAVVLIVNLMVYRAIEMQASNILNFCLYGFLFVLLNSVLYVVVFSICNFLIKQTQRASKKIHI